RRFATTTEKTLVRDLRRILKPKCAAHARTVAPRMTTPAQSVAAATDRLEEFARVRGIG
ncbi:glycosyl transferase family 1, partial [Mycobacterium sp. ITM-2017-0098]